MTRTGTVGRPQIDADRRDLYNGRAGFKGQFDLCSRAKACKAMFERECGFKLPQEFKEFTMLPLGEMYMEVREDH